MVSQVDFYLSAGERPQSQPLLACRLAAKAFDHNLKSYILASDKRQVRILDQLLWTYDDCSFIPHEALLTVDAPSTPCPVLIGSIDAEKTGFDVLISLCPDIPQTTRIITELLTSSLLMKPAWRWPESDFVTIVNRAIRRTSTN